VTGKKNLNACGRRNKFAHVLLTSSFNDLYCFSYESHVLLGLHSTAH